MRALNRKLLRDLLRLRAQAFSVLIVMALGIGLMAAALGLRASLIDARDRYYREQHFSDLQVQLQRAPRNLLPELAALPGVQALDARVAASATLSVPDDSAPVTARLYSIEDPRTTPVNRPWLVQGRWPEAGADQEVVINEAFFTGRKLSVGARLQATVRGTRMQLHVVGVANAPEFVFASPPGELFPQPERFALMWMPRRGLETVAGMDGAFNDLVLTLGARADAQTLARTLESRLARYGARQTVTRARVPSARFLDQEVDQLSTMAKALPPAFLAVAAFLLSVTLNRHVESERAQIGLMQAMGLSARRIAANYVWIALILGALGIVLGLLIGQGLGTLMAGLYLHVYRLPALPFSFDTTALLTCLVAGVLAALTGALSALRRALKLAPAAALQPPPPPNFRASSAAVERSLGKLDALTRVVLRRIVGFPRRSLTTMAGFCFALALMQLSQQLPLAIDSILELTFEKSRRQDVSLSFVETRANNVERTLRHLPGVLQLESYRAVPAIFEGPGGRVDEALFGLAEPAQLNRLIDVRGQAAVLRDDGLTLTNGLARQLGVNVGDRVRIRLQRGAQRELSLTVVARITVSSGTGAYMERDALSRLIGESGQIDGVYLRVDARQLEGFNHAVRDLPGIMGVSYTVPGRVSMERNFREGTGVMANVFILFSVLMSAGIAYATSTVTLAEQRRDLATLQVLGFSRQEASFVLVAEVLFLAVLALAPGLLLGQWGAMRFLEIMATDIFAFPEILVPRAFAVSATVVMAAVIVSVFWVRRQVDAIDLVESMKQRE